MTRSGILCFWVLMAGCGWAIGLVATMVRSDIPGAAFGAAFLVGVVLMSATIATVEALP